MMENKQEGGFFTIGKDNKSSSSSTQQQYLDKFSSALQSAENQMGQQPMQQNAADNSLVDKKPGSFLF